MIFVAHNMLKDMVLRDIARKFRVIAHDLSPQENFKIHFLFYKFTQNGGIKRRGVHNSNSNQCIVSMKICVTKLSGIIKIELPFTFSAIFSAASLEVSQCQGLGLME